MVVSKKCQYALRAVFELAKRWNAGPIRIADIAEAQAIPARFLEVILNQLKQTGVVESRRGAEGGYLLGRHPRLITVGEVIRAVEGPIAPVECVLGDDRCPLHGECAFLPLWHRAAEALREVYDGTSFDDLLIEEARKGSREVLCYAI